MKHRKFITFGLAFLLALGLVLMRPTGTDFVQAQTNIDPEAPTISVSGRGAVNVTPDMATVTLGVTTENADARVALRENNEAMDAIIAAIKALGIAEDDIQTADFHMRDIRDWSRNVDRIIGYAVSNSVRVTIYDLGLVGDIIGDATAAGATVSGGVRFSVRDSAAAYNEALALAVANAASKADAIAGALDMHVATVVSVVETGGHHMPTNWASAMVPMAEMSFDMGMSVPVQTGELTVTANVQIVYTIR